MPIDPPPHRASFTTIDWYVQVTREALNLDQGGFNPESATLAGSSCVVRCSFARKFHSSGHINIQTRHITARASFIFHFGAKLHLSRVQIFTPTDRRDILILSLCTPGLASLFPSLQRQEFSLEIFARHTYLLRKKSTAEVLVKSTSFWPYSIHKDVLLLLIGAR